MDGIDGIDGCARLMLSQTDGITPPWSVMSSAHSHRIAQPPQRPFNLVRVHALQLTHPQTASEQVPYRAFSPIRNDIL
jgi:hypothetical protein